MTGRRCAKGAELGAPLTLEEAADLLRARCPARWTEPPTGHVALLLEPALRPLLPDYLDDLLTARVVSRWGLLSALLDRLAGRGEAPPELPILRAARTVRRLRDQPEVGVKAAELDDAVRALAYECFGAGPWPSVSPGTIEMAPIRAGGSAFELARFPVTHAQWVRVMGPAPVWRDAAPHAPVTQVSWLEAVAFCNQVSATLGYAPAYRVQGAQVERVRGADGLRLPTEAEWVTACAAGTRSRWSCGDSQGRLREHAWFGGHPRSDAPQPVGGKAPNPWGLYDLHGNVWEWCEDRFESDGPRRVCRGGSYCSPADACATAFRSRDLPTRRRVDLGFRLARTP